FNFHLNESSNLGKSLETTVKPRALHRHSLVDGITFVRWHRCYSQADHATVVIGVVNDLCAGTRFFSPRTCGRTSLQARSAPRCCGKSYTAISPFPFRGIV